MTSSPAAQIHPAEATTAAFALGGAFLEALTRRDFDAMAASLDPHIRFRALLPSRDVDVSSRAGAEEELRRWLGEHRGELAVLDATLGEVGPKLYLRWRLQFRTPTAVQILEQHAYAIAGDTGEHFTAMSVMCSGFVDVPAPTIADR